MSDSFRYRDGQLYCGNLAVADIASDHGTPLYIYSAGAIRENYRALRNAFAEANPLICYSIKANFSLAVCSILKQEGSGFDIVSGGELFRASTISADPQKICYAGVGKTVPEIEAALNAGILMFNVESEPELDRIDAVARRLKTSARIALRINPDVDGGTHHHTTTGKKENKFGIDFDSALGMVRRMKNMAAVRFAGVHVHIGSPIYTPGPYAQALELVLDFIGRCRVEGHEVEWLDIGGGFGIDYKGGESAVPADYAAAILPFVRRSGCKLIIEPGRSIIGNAAILVTRVQYIKQTHVKRFVICDAGMNDLIRPALYDSYHRIWPVHSDQPLPRGEGELKSTDGRTVVDVVGPICESGDYFAKARPLPPVKEDDLLAIFSAGAYGYSMSSNYNSRPRVSEVMVDGDAVRLIRARETYSDLIDGEQF